MQPDMKKPDRNHVDIVALKTSKIRVYLVQYWSASRQRRVEEYADAMPESEPATLSLEDQAKIAPYTQENLGLPPLP